MKQRLLFALVAAILPVIAFTSCTYNPNASASENAAQAWNNPATQQEVAVLTEIGTSALNAWIKSQATKGRHASKERFIEFETNKAAKHHPDVPRAKIKATIRAKLSAK